MPALAYTARPSSLPPLIYCDSSFLFDLFGAADPARLAKYPMGVRTRATDATTFFTWAKQHGVAFVTSLLALEEIHRVIVFNPINAELHKKRKVKGINTWKDLKAKKPAVFQQKLEDGRRMLSVFQRFFTALKIPLVMFGRSRVPNEDLAA